MKLTKSDTLINSLYAATYAIALAIFVSGTHIWAYSWYRINMFVFVYEEAGQLVLNLYKMSGWTLCFFGPVGLATFALALNRLIAFPYPRMLERTLETIHELDLPIGIGLLGTLWGFISVATQSLHNGSPTEALSSILVGMGSTFLGVLLSISLKLLIKPDQSDA